MSDASVRAWILVFDVDAESALHPNPIVVTKTIATNAASIARYTLEDVPHFTFSSADDGGALVNAIHQRLEAWWPELSREPRAPRSATP